MSGSEYEPPLDSDLTTEDVEEIGRALRDFCLPLEARAHVCGRSWGVSLAGTAGLEPLGGREISRFA